MPSKTELPDQQSSKECGKSGRDGRNSFDSLPYQSVKDIFANALAADAFADYPSLPSVVTSLERDSLGRIRTKECTRSDGRVTVEKDDENGVLTELDIADQNGTTSVKRSSDPFSSWFVGKRIDKNTHVEQEVIIARNFLVCLNQKSKAIESAERLDYKFNDPQSLPSYVSGRLDADRGFFQYKEKNGYVYKQYMASGRWDIFDGDKVSFVGPFGLESATETPQLTTLKHGDGSAITLQSNQFKRIDATGRITTESATADEQRYLTAHAQADRRDIASVHERLGGSSQLDNFYQSLTKFDSATNIPHDVATAIQDNLLHEVAYPAEIYQGSMGSCNVTTVQRELAIDRPALLADEVFDVAELGKIKGSSGKVYLEDRNQLLKRDLSGRDVASRIFQSAAIDVEEQRNGMHFRNTMDGVGRLVHIAGVMSKFNGLSLGQIADVGFELEGETHSIVRVHTPADLKAAFDYQKGRAMIAEVDASMPPFTRQTIGNKRAGHVVNLTSYQFNNEGGDSDEQNTSAQNTRTQDIEVGFENQWGLESDHSLPTAMVDARTLIGSMAVTATFDGTRTTRPYGQLLMRGLQQNAQYEFVDGKLKMVR